MLLHVLGGTVSARSLTVAFRLARTTTIATGTERDVVSRFVAVATWVLHVRL
jgi:hypothetical protein